MRSRFWAPLVGPPSWAAALIPAAPAAPEPVEMPSYDRPADTPPPVEMPSYDRPADTPPPVEMPVVSSGPPLRGAYARRATR